MSRLYPDEALSREIRKRSMEHSWDSEPIWDVQWNPLRKRLCLMQRRKPDKDYPRGRWTIWALLSDEEGKPRQVQRSDINLLMDHVYGKGRFQDDWSWYEKLVQEEYDATQGAADRMCDEGRDDALEFRNWFDKPKSVGGVSKHRMHASAQRRCPHDEWMVDCPVCSPSERLVFTGNSVRRERGRRGTA
jgi:hypothetical protein